MTSPACREHEPCDECKTCATGRCCRSDNPDYRLPVVGSIAPFFGELGRRNDDGTRVECHICGGWFLSVGSHSWAAHDVTMEEYRAAFGLSRRGMLGSGYRSRWQEIQRAAAARRPPMPSVPPTAEQRRAGRESLESRRAITAGYARSTPALLAAGHSASSIAKMRETKRRQRTQYTCVVCGSTFESPSHRASTCSPTCRAIRRRDVASSNMRARIAAGHAPAPPALGESARAAIGAKARERWAKDDGSAKKAAGLRLSAYYENIGPKAAAAQRRAANTAAVLKTRKPHYCTAGCGSLIARASPRTCSPECRRRVRQETARRALAARS